MPAQLPLAAGQRGRTPRAVRPSPGADLAAGTALLPAFAIGISAPRHDLLGMQTNSSASAGKEAKTKGYESNSRNAPKLPF